MLLYGRLNAEYTFDGRRRTWPHGASRDVREIAIQSHVQGLDLMGGLLAQTHSMASRSSPSCGVGAWVNTGDYNIREHPTHTGALAACKLCGGTGVCCEPWTLDIFQHDPKQSACGHSSYTLHTKHWLCSQASSSVLRQSSKLTKPLA